MKVKSGKKEEAKMGRTPCCNKEGLRKGAWTAEEDKILVAYITKNGHGNWRSLPKLAGLLRCGKSCRLRWTNYLRPGIKRGQFSSEEVDTIIQLHTVLGNKWSAIASHLPGRTDNDIKNFWNSHLRKQGSDPNHQNHQMPHPHGNIDEKVETPSTNHMVQWERVSVSPSLLDLPSASKMDRDPFLRLWNSEVGEAFCSFKKPCGVPCQSPVSSSSKFESSSGTTLHSEPASKLLSSADTVEGVPMNCEVEEEEEEEDTKSYELVDPSETTLKLLLDFPPAVNDMGFFQGLGDNLSIYLQN